MDLTDLAITSIKSVYRRVAALEVEPQWLLRLLQSMGRHGQIHRIDGLPDDARIVSMDVNHARNVIILYLESESFMETAPGCQPPSLHALTETVYTLSPERRTEFESWIGR